MLLATVFSCGPSVRTSLSTENCDAPQAPLSVAEEHSTPDRISDSRPSLGARVKVGDWMLNKAISMAPVFWGASCVRWRPQLVSLSPLKIVFTNTTMISSTQQYAFVTRVGITFREREAALFHKGSREWTFSPRLDRWVPGIEFLSYVISTLDAPEFAEDGRSVKLSETWVLFENYADCQTSVSRDSASSFAGLGNEPWDWDYNASDVEFRTSGYDDRPKPVY